MTDEQSRGVMGRMEQQWQRSGGGHGTVDTRLQDWMWMQNTWMH